LTKRLKPIHVKNAVLLKLGNVCRIKKTVLEDGKNYEANRRTAKCAYMNVIK